MCHYGAWEGQDVGEGSQSHCRSGSIARHEQRFGKELDAPVIDAITFTHAPPETEVDFAGEKHTEARPNYRRVGALQDTLLDQ